MVCKEKENAARFHCLSTRGFGARLIRAILKIAGTGPGKQTATATGSLGLAALLTEQGACHLLTASPTSYRAEKYRRAWTYVIRAITACAAIRSISLSALTPTTTWTATEKAAERDRHTIPVKRTQEQNSRWPTLKQYANELRTVKANLLSLGILKSVTQPSAGLPGVSDG